MRELVNNFGDIKDGELVITGDPGNDANRGINFTEAVCVNCDAIYDASDFRLSF